jgi:hypothetical protein
VPDLTLSVSPPGLGELVRRVGVKASFSLPTGETPRLCGVVSLVLVELVLVEVSESTRVASVVVAKESTESTVSEVIRGDERVSSPACELCGDMPGRRCGELRRRLVGAEGAVRVDGEVRICREEQKQWTKEQADAQGITNDDVKEGKRSARTRGAGQGCAVRVWTVVCGAVGKAEARLAALATHVCPLAHASSIGPPHAPLFLC